MKLFSLKKLVAGLRARRGWPRAWAAFAFGCVASLAFPPINLFPVFWISFPAFIFLLQGAPDMKTAFATGWSFAFGLFLCGLYWIAAAMFVDIKAFWWGVPLAVAGLPAFLAVYYGLVAVAARALGLKGIAGALGLALLWFLADYARGHMLTGFPWNLEGYAWNGVAPMLQTASLAGIYGLTLVTLVAASLPAALIDQKPSSRIAVAASLLALLALGAWGALRLNRDAPMTDLHLRIVQPNVGQAHKWVPQERAAHFQELLNLSFAPGAKPLQFIVWPETASTFYLVEDDVARKAIARAIPGDAYVITGVIRRELGAGENPKRRYYNSLIAFDHSGNIAAIYDKFHLVPFGEYIPFRRYIPIHALATLGTDFSFGPGVRTLHIDGLPPFSPLICYEAIFPGEVADRHDRPQFLLNVTNDGWYARTAGPYQHFAAARVRAIEEGLPLVRAANTGISGIIDAYGRVKTELALGETGFIDGDLPQFIAPTVFERFGEKPLWILFAVLCGAILLARGKAK